MAGPHPVGHGLHPNIRAGRSLGGTPPADPGLRLARARRHWAGCRRMPISNRGKGPIAARYRLPPKAAESSRLFSGKPAGP